MADLILNKQNLENGTLNAVGAIQDSHPDELSAIDALVAQDFSQLNMNSGEQEFFVSSANSGSFTSNLYGNTGNELQGALSGYVLDLGEKGLTSQRNLSLTLTKEVRELVAQGYTMQQAFIEVTESGSVKYYVDRTTGIVVKSTTFLSETTHIPLGKILSVSGKALGAYGTYESFRPIIEDSYNSVTGSGDVIEPVKSASAFGVGAVVGGMVGGILVAAEFPVLLGLAALGVVGAIATGVSKSILDELPSLIDTAKSAGKTLSEVHEEAQSFVIAKFVEAFDEVGEDATALLETVEDIIEGFKGSIEELAGDNDWPLSAPDSLLDEIPQWLLDLPIFTQSGIEVRGNISQGSPLVFDLDGDGEIELVSLEDSTVQFDFWDDGSAKKIGWVDVDDGLLVHDIDGDGNIEGVWELFGSPYFLGELFNNDWVALRDTENGFGALAIHDLAENGGNEDGVINASDTIWTELQIWQDLNQNGVSDDSELLTLDGLGIQSIDVSNFAIDSFTGQFNRIIEGNVITHSGFYTMDDGSTREVVDAWFHIDLQNTSYDEPYNLDVRALFLPTLRGYGDLPDLHIQASIDNGEDGLLESLESFTAERNFTELFSDLSSVQEDVRSLLMQWADIDVSGDVSHELYGTWAYMPEFIFMHKLAGRESQYLDLWFDNSSLLPRVSDASEVINDSWDQIFNAFSARLVFQAGGDALFESGVTYNPLTDLFEGNISIAQTSLDILETEASSHADVEAFWLNIANYLDGVKGITNLTAAEITLLDDAISASSGSALSWSDIEDALSANVINGTSATETINGSIYNDVINSNGGDDILIGGEGNDILNGWVGYSSFDKTYIGGAGNDVMHGGVGNDTYVYESGHDVIVEVGANFYNDLDVIEMDAGISINDVSLHISKTDTTYTEHLTIEVAGRGTITIQNDTSTSSPYSKLIDEIRFDNGDVLVLENAHLTSHGTNSDDTLVPIDAFDGYMTIYGYDGNDNIFYNQSQDITIDGGNGDDYVTGGSGDTTYIVSQGNDIYQDAGGNDTIVLPEGITLNDLDFIYANNSTGVYQGVQINISGLGSLLLDYQFYTQSDLVETLELSDGSTVNLADQVYKVVGTSGDDYHADSHSWSNQDTIYVFGEGHDVIRENYGGTDTILFGEGVTLSDLNIYQRFGFIPLIGTTANQLVIEDQNGNSLTVVRQFEYSYSATQEKNFSIEHLEFFDGTVVNIEDLLMDTYGTSDIDGINTDPANNHYAFDDVIYGLEGNDSISAYEGNDTINGGAGNDFIVGGAGDDIINGGADNDTLFGNDGNDTFVFDTGFGTDNINHFEFGTDVIDLSAISSVQSINDLTMLQNGSFIEITVGSEGLIKVYNPGLATITASDFIFASVITGTSGNDTIYGTADADLIYGLGGDDYILGDDGDDEIYGGDGDDNLYGNGGVDTIYGEAGDDLISGHAESDTIYGGDGNDDLFGYENSDLIYGGSGSDKIYGDDQDGLDTYTLGGADEIHGEDGNDQIFAGVGDDLVYGDAGDDDIYGHAGNDTIYGGANNDRLYGGDGNDTFYGGDDSDTIWGGNGDDIIIGGNGRDYLNGEGGADTFYLDLDEVDRVRDFDQSEGDKINIADLLDGFDSATDDVNNFVDITIRSSTRTDIRVDEDGQGGNFQYVGIIYGDLTGETVDSLVASGALITT